jgi:hypothetical protein
MGFVWVCRVQRVLSRINLGFSGLSISGSPLMGLSLNPSISLSWCVSDEKRKKERVIGQEEEKGGRSVWRNRERREKEEKKRIIKKYNKKIMENNI